MTSPATVVFVDHASALGGAEVSLLTLLAELDTDRFRPVLATVEGELARAARDQGVSARLIDLPRLRGQLSGPSHLVSGTRSLTDLLRLEDAQVVHSNTYRASIYTAFAAASTRRPFVWHVRDMLGGPVARLLALRAHSTIAISNAVAERLPSHANARVIYNPVAAREPAPLSREKLGLPPEGKLLASIGRLREWKGHGSFLEAASHVKDPDCLFLVIGGRIFPDGEPDYGPELVQQAQRLGIGDRTTFLGQRDDLPAIFGHLAVVVHAADAEPFGRVVAEAQLGGVPVVAFADGGIPEIIEANTTGILTTPGDTVALAEGVDRLLADSAEADRMGKAAQKRAARMFAPATHARSVEAVYDEIIAGAAEAAGPAASS